MLRKWISMLLAAMMLLSLSAPAFANGEAEEAPPPAAEEAPMACEQELIDAGGENEEVFLPEEEVVPTPEEAAPTAVISAYSAPVSESGVTVNLTGTMEGFDQILYTSPDGERTYFADNTGIYYYEVHGTEINATRYTVEAADNIPTQLSVYPGCMIEVRMTLGYTVTVENGTITHDEYASTTFYRVDVKVPESGTVTIQAAPTDEPVPEMIPFTFYNEDLEHGVIGGGSSALEGVESGNYSGHFAYGYDEVNVAITGGAFEVWTAPGYAIEVLKGGYIAETRAPTGANAAYVPTGTTCYVLHVDLGADEFVIAAVKVGEHFTIPEMTAPETETGGTFRDVAQDSWYADAVEEAYSMGIVKGVSDDAFSPNGLTTRGQAVTMLYRMEGSPAVTGRIAFTDLTEDYYQDAVAWAAADGVVKGVSETSFDPDAPITREQWAVMLYRMAGEPIPYAGGLLEQYSDYDVTGYDYAYAAMLWAVDNGLISGYEDGTLRPTATATRAEVCAMLMRYRALYL